jgi:hypothetical protein
LYTEAAVDSATQIDVGDLVYLDTDDAKPASSQADQGTETANQQLFHDVFLGVAASGHTSGSGASTIRVCVGGVLTFTCLTATLEIGDLIGPDEDAGGTFLQDQVVAKVTTANAAIGRVVKRVSSGTSVMVYVESSIVFGGPQNIL